METIVEEQIDSKDKELDQPTFIEMGNFSSSRGEVSVNRSGHQFMYPANPHLKPTMIKEKIVFEDSDDDDEYN